MLLAILLIVGVTMVAAISWRATMNSGCLWGLGILVSSAFGIGLLVFGLFTMLGGFITLLGSL